MSIVGVKNYTKMARSDSNKSNDSKEPLQKKQLLPNFTVQAASIFAYYALLLPSTTLVTGLGKTVLCPWLSIANYIVSRSLFNAISYYRHQL